MAAATDSEVRVDAQQLRGPWQPAESGSIKGHRIRGERDRSCLCEKKESASQQANKSEVWRKEKGDASSGEEGRRKM